MRNALVALLAVVFFSGCIHSPPHSNKEARKPSSIQSELDGIIEDHFRKLLSEYRAPDAPVLKVRRFPPETPADIEGMEAFNLEDWTVRTGYDRYTRFVKRLAEEGRGSEADEYSAFSTPVPDKQESAASRILARFSKDDRQDLLRICSGRFRGLGDQIRGQILWVSPFCNDPGAFVFDEDLREAFLSIPEKPIGVKYDGDFGFHRYQNQKLEGDVLTIAAAIDFAPAKAREIFNQLPEARRKIFQFETSSTTEKSKIEPFDLVANKIVGFMMGRHVGKDSGTKLPLNKIQISKMVQKGLAYVFNLYGPQFDHITKTPFINVLRTETAMTVFCVDGLFQDEAQMDANQNRDAQKSWYRRARSLVSTWVAEFNYATDLKAASFVCNAQNYQFEFKRVEAAEIPAPAPFQIQPDKDLNALITISLVSEIDRSSIEKGRTLMTLAGWKVDEDLQEVDTKQYFNQVFPAVDAYVPVMHSMDLNSFQIGSEKSMALKISKDVRGPSGSVRRLRLTVLFPLADGNITPLVYRPDDLAQLMDVRSMKNKTPLFLMNNSCDSQKTLPAWALVFRKALDLRKKREPQFKLSEVRDFPYIVGSKRYFSTSSIAQIFGHAEYPLKSLEMLAQGASVPDVISFLEMPPNQGFISKMKSFFSSSESLDSESRGFEPDYSEHHPELRRLKGFEVYLYGRGIKGSNAY